MSLLSESFEDFALMQKTSVQDGEGGMDTEYTETEIFPAVANDVKSSSARVAQAITGKAAYIITTHRDVSLDFYAIIKRLSDGALFRITSLSEDNKTPISSALDIRQYDAEKWSMPT